ncbi:universal stress protein [Chryseobacterium sp. Y16C]|uniref:universal stress protein n=1 Tax=Chryseobacterium sp. Y16C TaxID=2920939 RepID=UPI001F0A89F2|nr:universal stress protein [Chryseobacterium sp. Y16C]UMQ43155.1 universal stress protein [Chryseobacterium sp. Y16C]
MELISKILIAVDGSASSEKIVEYGYNMARQIHARVGILMVEDSDINLADTLVEYVNSLNKDQQPVESDFLYKMKSMFAKGTPTELFLVKGPVRDVIFDTATAWGAQIIVAGIHHQTGISRFFVSSTADDLLHSTNIPIILVPLSKTEQ